MEGGDGGGRRSNQAATPPSRVAVTLRAVPAPQSIQSLQNVANETVFFKQAKESRV